MVENIALIVPGSKPELARRIRALGEEFGLSVDPFAMVHGLSVGEQQRVEIIRCLLLDPRLLILDEPTSVLPPQSVTRLFETLRALRDKGMAILFISHKLEEIKELCDTATILRAGQVTGRVNPAEHDAHGLATMMIAGTCRHRCIPHRVRSATRGWNWPGSIIRMTIPSAFRLPDQPVGWQRRDRRHCRDFGQRPAGACRPDLRRDPPAW